MDSEDAARNVKKRPSPPPLSTNRLATYSATGWAPAGLVSSRDSDDPNCESPMVIETAKS